jgi:PAS domain S-box-containing protein
MLLNEQHKNSLLGHLLNSSSVMVYILDVQERKTIYINNSLENLLGYSLDTFFQYGNEVLQKVMHPDTYANFPAVLKKLATLKEGDEYTNRESYKKADGTWGWYKNTRTVFSRDENSNIKWVLGFVSDITADIEMIKDLRQTSERLNAIFNSSGDSNFFIDKDFRIIDINAAAKKYVKEYTGVTLKEGDLITNAMTPELISIAKVAMQQVLKGEQVDVTKSYIRVDGKTIWFRAKVFPVYSNDGNISGVLLNMRDVTKITDYSNALEQQNRVLTEIARINSHEIRKPLANILGLAEMMYHYKDKLPTDLLDLLEMLHASSNELDGVIKKIVNKAAAS